MLRHMLQGRDVGDRRKNTGVIEGPRVESQLRIMAKCKPGSKIYTDCIKALQSVEEIGRLTLVDAHDASSTSEPAVRRGRQAGGRQGRGGPQSSQRPTSIQPPTPVPTSSRRPTSGQRHTPVPTSSQLPTSSRLPTSSQRPTSSWHHTPVQDHTMEKVSQIADEMCLDTGYDMGSMAHDDVGPSHKFAHRDTSRSPSIRTDGTCPPTSPTTSPLPTTRTSPPLNTGTTPTNVHGRDEMRFMPTAGRPTPGAVPPEFVHTEFIQTQIPTPYQRLHTLRVGRKGRNGHGHILLTMGLEMEVPIKNHVYLMLGGSFGSAAKGTGLKALEFALSICESVDIGRSRAQLVAVDSAYHNFYGNSLKKAVKKETSGNFEFALLTILQCDHNPRKYFAKVLHNAMKGLGTNDTTLIRIVVTRAEIDM
nr:annexin d5 [Quercus suber]